MGGSEFFKKSTKKVRFLKKSKIYKWRSFKKQDLKKIKGKFDYVVNLGGYVDHTNKTKHSIVILKVAKI